ncbi:MAG: hypothetical protein WCA31_11810, partial [Acidimicrobiales bacterium]
VPLRGNMERRLAAVGENGVDAIVAAMAGLERLGKLDVVSEALDPSWFVPQVGQGAIALETRADDTETRASLDILNDDRAYVALAAERAFLVELGAGCSIPVAAHGYVSDDMVTLYGVMLCLDGTRSVRGELSGLGATALGTDLAGYLRDDLGGGEFVDLTGS